MPKLFRNIRIRKDSTTTATAVQEDAISLSSEYNKCSTSLKNSSKGKSKRKSLFRRMRTSKTSNHGRKNPEQAESTIQPTDTFSISEDEASQVSSSLFSPVYNVVIEKQTLEVVEEESTTVPTVHKSETIDTTTTQDTHQSEDTINHGQREKETSSSENLEVEHLQKLVADLKTLHTVEMELKDIEIQNLQLDLESIRDELSKTRMDLIRLVAEHGKVVEAFAKHTEKKYDNLGFSPVSSSFVLN